MSRARLWLITVAFHFLLRPVGAEAQPRSYTPAIYGPLRMGTATRGEALRHLGSPKYSGPLFYDRNTIVDEYARPGLFPFSYERVLVYSDLKSRFVFGIEVQLEEEIPMERLRQAFPGKWSQTRWDQDVCANPELETLFESPSGLTVAWENRQKGLTYRPEIKTFEYRSTPIGLPKSKGCK